MRILVAPDKFKGSLTAAQAATAIAEGVLRILPQAEIKELPIADGGEGTLEAAFKAGYEEQVTTVSGPLGHPIDAVWALRKDSAGMTSAVIETAKASGLELLKASPTPSSALLAHSYGAGQLIAAALDAGAQELIIGVGGSAMTDGGMGAIRALGLSVQNARDQEVPLGGGSLAEVAVIDAAGLDPRLAECRLRFAVDVRNPLHGVDGAAYVYGPQKGADTDSIGLLDAGLQNWSKVLTVASRREHNIPGSGAAGGFPAPFLAFTEATLEGGYALVAELTGLRDELAESDLIITGEGSLDAQSLQGKAPIALARDAAKMGIPVAIVAGRILVTADDLAANGVTSSGQLLDIASWTSGTPDVEDAKLNAALYLRTLTARVLTTVSGVRSAFPSTGRIHQ